MVAKLTYFLNDPQKRGRGAGWYYHRGRGQYSRIEDVKAKGGLSLREASDINPTARIKFVIRNKKALEKAWGD